MAAEELERDSLIERLNRGRQAKATMGGYAGYGSPAFGQRALNGELVDDPQEQHVIELIRRHHKSGKSLQQIANWLNHHGYTTKRGQQWKRISVKRVLDRLYGRTPRVSSLPQNPSQGNLNQ
ncbi:MAG: recombinase [Moorea sp. SIO3I7]|uniref:recombinase family protein n=1 Tax=Moorena sp. SIO4A5 TaxID=2607838 RepID=UPI0013C9E5F5|nr:recombinase family protein [Moorena sp. SIO4A5]NEO03173.1 recombinase [Moorena sp. SIO3I7]NEO24206.1 recombinase [Moorena sp. SIO4A5]NEO48471.1 recombinase [Moorena sp. SIO4A3]